MGKAGFLLILTTLLACTSASDVRVSMASVILEEGQTGKIFCVVKGIGSYYWRKGDFIDNSTKVASIVSGVPSAGDGSYSVNENGTLFIRRVVLEDEGKYFCRVASDETDCSGEVMIYVQASLPNFVIGIDRCYTKHSCSVLIDSSQSTSLTCIARNASCSMILKWFNGSTEITNHIRKNSSIVQGVREISSTLDVAHGKKGSLTCQAVEPKGRNDNGRFANVQLEMPEVPVVTGDNRLGSVAVALITSGACLILFVILLLVKDRLTRRKRKSKDKVQGEELKSLMVKEDNNEKRITEQKEEISRLRVKEDSNGKQITELKEEISRLKTTKENKEEQIMKENKEISRLKAKEEYNEKEITKQKEEIYILRTNKANTEEQIMKKDKGVSGLKGKLVNREREIAEMREELHNRDREIAVMKMTKENKEEQMKKQDEEISISKTTEASKEEQIMEQVKEISRLKEELHNRDKEIAVMKTTQENKEEQIKKQDEEISILKTTEASKEEQIMEQVKEISRLKTTQENKEEQIMKQDKEITRVKEELQNRDREIAVMKAEIESKMFEVAEPEELKRKTPKKPKLSVEEPQQKVEELQQLDVELGDVSDSQ